MSRSAPGRNDPCPCGSGAKYKRCCLPKADARDAARLRLLDVRERLTVAITNWALDRWGPEMFDEAWEEFFDWDDVPEEVETEPNLDTLFAQWFVFSFVPDPYLDTAPDGAEADDGEAVEPRDVPDAPFAQVFLEEQPAGRIAELDRAFLEATLQSPTSFLVVTDCTSDGGVDLRDVFSGRTHQLQDRNLAASVEVASLIYARVVTVGDCGVVVGCSPWVIPPTWHTPIIEFRQRVFGEARVDPRVLCDADRTLRTYYLFIEDELLDPSPPAFQNTDGDPIQPARLEFELSTTPAVAFERLKLLARQAEDEELLADAVHEADGVLERFTLPWMSSRRPEAESATELDGGSTLLGTVDVVPGRIVAEVNSERRAHRLRRLVERRLRGKVEFSRMEVASLDDELGADASGPADGVDSSADEPLDTPEIHARLIRATAHRWERWLDEHVPALGGQTPREASATALGRERLEALFAQFAWKRRQAAGRQPCGRRRSPPPAGAARVSPTAAAASRRA